MFERTARLLVLLAAACALTGAAGDRGASIYDDNPQAVRAAVEAIEAEAASQGDIQAAGTGSQVPLLVGPVEAIKLTVRFSPEIRRAYERRLAEESRYDFFICSREALSYGSTTEINYAHTHTADDRLVEKRLSPSVFVKKEFYNTASASMRLGYDVGDSTGDFAANGFVSGTLSAPLFASREALERSNDKIYEQTKVNDARLEYYQRIREEVNHSLNSLANVQRNQEELALVAEYEKDLTELLAIAKAVQGRDTSFDAGKIQATLTTVSADRESTRNYYEISAERLRNVMGIPFGTAMKVAEDGFDPFRGENQEELERVAVETDEEIKTLLNSIKNAQAELDLARKGKWDTTLFVDGTREFAGRGGSAGDASYSLATGVEVTRIDNRISRNLEQVALANIREYRNAIISRRREIHTNILDAFKNLTGSVAEGQTRQGNLSKYRDDYAKGIELYKSGAITIDELIRKRQAIQGEWNAISWSRQNSRESIASLLSATGRYEQFLDEKDIAGKNSSKNTDVPGARAKGQPAPGEGTASEAVKDAKKQLN